jgi:hypothetical protein
MLARLPHLGSLLLQLAAHGWARETEALCACLGHAAPLLPLPARARLGAFAAECCDRKDVQARGGDTETRTWSP